jgi:hypothetical protein
MLASDDVRAPERDRGGEQAEAARADGQVERRRAEGGMFENADELIVSWGDQR